MAPSSMIRVCRTRGIAARLPSLRPFLLVALGGGLRRVVDRQPLLAIEPRGARMQRNRQPVERLVEPDPLADRIERIEQPPRPLMPQRLGYRIDEIRVDIGIDQPQGVKPDGSRLDIDPGVEPRRDDRPMIEGKVLLEPVDQLAFYRHQPDRNRGGEIPDRRNGVAADQEERVDISALHLLRGWARAQELASKILLTEPGTGEENSGVRGGPRTRFAERDAFSLQIRQ